MLAALLGGAAIAGTSILNYQMQKKQLDYQKEQDALQRSREDSAYQRTVKDMRAAGLNPLMMSSTDTATPSVAGTLPAPQVDTSAISNIGTALGELPQRINQFQLDRQRLRVQEAQIKQAELQNEYDSSTLNYRIRLQAFQTISGMYDTLDKRSKAVYNNFFGINDDMTDKERYLQIARKMLGFDKGTYDGSGKDYRDLEHTLDLENFDKYASPSKMSKDDLKNSIESLFSSFSSDSAPVSSPLSILPKVGDYGVPSLDFHNFDFSSDDSDSLTGRIRRWLKRHSLDTSKARK